MLNNKIEILEDERNNQLTEITKTLKKQMQKMIYTTKTLEEAMQMIGNTEVIEEMHQQLKDELEVAM